MHMMHVYNKRTDTIPTDAVYVGRGSPWGNPFIIGRDGDRATVIAKYHKHTLPTFGHGRWGGAFQELWGKDLVCYCAPRACHADLLLMAAEWELQCGDGSETAADIAWILNDKNRYEWRGIWEPRKRRK
jgi:hypothetical protein